MVVNGLETDQSVRTTRHRDGLPVIVTPIDDKLAVDSAHVVEWFAVHLHTLETAVTSVGAILLRGFAMDGIATFDQLAATLPPADLDYSAGGAPRAQIAGRVYEATRLPPAQRIALHQEMSYLPRYPTKVMFFCLTAPTQGGETILGDMRKLDRSIPSDFREQVRSRGLRNYRSFRDPEQSTGHPLLDLHHRPWTEAFSASNRHEAEARCTQMGLQTEWLDDGSVNTYYPTSGFARHPVTGIEIWFNQISMQHTALSIDPERRVLFERYCGKGVYGYSGTTWGDGARFTEDEITMLKKLGDDIVVAEPWQQGDVLIVDNVYTGHGRNPCEGDREIQVAMIGPVGIQ